MHIFCYYFDFYVAECFVCFSSPLSFVVLSFPLCGVKRRYSSKQPSPISVVPMKRAANFAIVDLNCTSYYYYYYYYSFLKFPVSTVVSLYSLHVVWEGGIVLKL
uniref:Uncharacterized protein n=1 Tax=Trypanosoma congolense (strain IL3000) TaxID=1068625 RepID=G0UR67_TRYCI|nr:hypothetical protein, unlikely [Trypanosoma congolense IL3000]